ncbi:MAG: VPGUxxT family thioredoxin-like (seleno)protein, type 2 [Bacteroidota bacterium]
MSKLLLLLAVFIWTSASIPNKTKKIPKNLYPKNQPVELGKVNWMRNFDEALQQSQSLQKPVFIFFQEVPGCSTCRNYGQEVLSHPLIVEAIETLFVPLAIYNNKGGADKKVLQYYKEPAWNNPVVRIVDSNKENIIPRLNGNYSPIGVVEAMINALDRQLDPVPEYLSLLHKELLAQKKGTASAYFAMHCFWTGEKKLGQLEGVVATRPGFMDGREVVEVNYDPNTLSFDHLVEEANKQSCASHVYTTESSQEKAAKTKVTSRQVSPQKNFRPDSEPKFYLSKTHYQYVPMTALQAARANSLIAQLQLPDSVLSPKQVELAQYIKAHSDKKWTSAIGLDLSTAWAAIDQQLLSH